MAHLAGENGTQDFGEFVRLRGYFFCETREKNKMAAAYHNKLALDFKP
jgi:hypothetical protein